MSRHQSVDVLRTIAIISVIAIHTTPFATQSSPIGRSLDLAIVINQFARFAVPFFFVLSGYFWGQKFNDGKKMYGPTVKMAKRISLLFVAWSVIYIFPFNIYDSFSYGAIGPIKEAYWNLSHVTSKPLEGTRVHLWFLVALLCSLSISALLIRLELTRLLVVVAVIFYAVGLAGKAYCDTPFGFHTDFNFRDGPFFSLIFFVTGYLLQRRQPSDAWAPIGLAVAVIGIFLHFAEILLLQKYWGTSMNQDYVIGTYFFGVGVTLVALSNTKHLHFPFVASIGPFVLGIYASHMAFVEILRPIDRHFAGSGIWGLSYIAVVFMLSFALALMLSRFRLTRGLAV